MYEAWDGLRGCDNCGNDTTGRLCHSCATQEMIDKSDVGYNWPTLYCDKCKDYTLMSDIGGCEICGYPEIVE